MRRLLLGQVPAEETPAVAPTGLEALLNVKRFRILISSTVGDIDPAAKGRIGIFLAPGAGYVLAYTYDPECSRAQEFAESLYWSTPLTWNGSSSSPIPAPPSHRRITRHELGTLA